MARALTFTEYHPMTGFMAPAISRATPVALSSAAVSTSAALPALPASAADPSGDEVPAAMYPRAVAAPGRR